MRASIRPGTGHSAGPTPKASVLRSILVGEQDQDLALTPDGLQVVLATPDRTQHPVLETADLAVAALTDSNWQPVATAVRSDGLVANGIGPFEIVGHVPSPTYRFDALVRGSALGPVVRGSCSPPHQNLQPRGLTFSRRDLYTISRAPFRGFQVRVQPMPAVRPLSFTTDKTVYPRGARAPPPGATPSFRDCHRATELERAIDSLSNPDVQRGGSPRSTAALGWRDRFRWRAARHPRS
jgi:hypothetical protein